MKNKVKSSAIYLINAIYLFAIGTIIYANTNAVHAEDSTQRSNTELIDFSLKLHKHVTPSQNSILEAKAKTRSNSKTFSSQLHFENQEIDKTTPFTSSSFLINLIDFAINLRNYQMLFPFHFFW